MLLMLSPSLILSESAKESARDWESGVFVWSTAKV